MFRQTLGRTAICIALAGPVLAGDHPLDRIASDVLKGIRGAPENARLDGYRRLRDADHPIAEAVWKVSNARLRPVEGGALWASETSERYEVRDCVETQRARTKPPVIAFPQLAASPSFHRGKARYTPAPGPSTRRIALLFAPTSSLAIEAHARDDGELAFVGSFVIDAEVASEVVRPHSGGMEILPGAEPEGTLARLVPDRAHRTVRIEGTLRLPSQ